MTRAVAVVPLRGGPGKSRLADTLAAGDRVALVAALARHVVGVVASADGVDEVLVVCTSPDAVLAALAGGPPVRVLVQPAGRPGLDAAVDTGRAAVAGADPGARLLVVHADLPALTGRDVDALLAAPGPVTLAADRLGAGTNAVVLDRADRPFAFRFGPDSLAAHRAVAERHGLPVRVVERPGTAVDLDTAADWAALPPAVRRRLVHEVPALERLGG